MRIIFILHRSPPNYGATKVGDQIANSDVIAQSLQSEFIPIYSAASVDDVGKFSFKKIGLMLRLLLSITYSLLNFRPQVIYYTASTEGFAFYRDLFVTMPIKIYSLCTGSTIYYHFHTKGLINFTADSTLKKLLAKFLLWRVEIIALSPRLTQEYLGLSSNYTVHSLPNSVENSFADEDIFEQYLQQKFAKEIEVCHFLFMSNMIESKGYKKILDLALACKGKPFIFHFAGGWQSEVDEKYFAQFVEKNNLNDVVIYHSFVSGVEKDNLFKQANIMLFPTRYHKEAFPLCVLEAFSYGVPVIASDEASLPNIVNDSVGEVISDLNHFNVTVLTAYERLLRKETAMACRAHYLAHYTLPTFEQNLVNILKA